MAVLADIIGTLRSAFQLGPKASRLTLSWAGLSAPRTVTFADVAGEITTFNTNTTSPNATVPVKALQVVDGATNVDVAILPKGTGAFMLQIPDGTTAGGNKRGARAADFQTSRASADQVASGLGSFVAGNNNLASANYTAAVGGGNIASSAGAFVAGSGNTSSGIASVAIGLANLASGQGASAFGGSNTVSGSYASAFGVLGAASGDASVTFGAYSTTNGIPGQVAEGYWNLVGLGLFQATRTGLRKDTVGAASGVLTADAATAAVTNQLTLRANSVYRVRGTVVAVDLTSMDASEWVIDAMITRGVSAFFTSLIGTPTVVSSFATAGAAGWSVGVAADISNGALSVTGTGASGANTIRWWCQLQAVEVMGLPPGTDPNFSTVQLLLHFDGLNGATAFPDSSSSARTVTRVGDAQISTAEYVFGTSAVFDGAGDYLTVPSATGLQMAAADFCCEFRVRPTITLDSGTSQVGLVSKWGNYPGIEWMVDYAGGSLRLVYTDGSTTYTATYAVSLVAGTWYAIAVSRSGSSFRLFLDGTIRATSTTAITIPSTAQELRIGIVGNGVGPFAGYIDELRISKGTARYTANYTVAAAAFPNS